MNRAEKQMTRLFRTRVPIHRHNISNMNRTEIRLVFSYLNFTYSDPWDRLVNVYKVEADYCTAWCMYACVCVPVLGQSMDSCWLCKMTLYS